MGIVELSINQLDVFFLRDNPWVHCPNWEISESQTCILNSESQNARSQMRASRPMVMWTKPKPPLSMRLFIRPKSSSSRFCICFNIICRPLTRPFHPVRLRGTTCEFKVLKDCLDWNDLVSSLLWQKMGTLITYWTLAFTCYICLSPNSLDEITLGAVSCQKAEC